MRSHDEERESAIQYKQSLLVSEESPTRVMRYLTKLDFFSFLPVPKDSNVSTKQSIVGSVVFILLFLTYIIIQFTIFVSDNPAKIESFETELNDKFYELPRIAVAFQVGENLNDTDDYLSYYNFSFTKEYKSKEGKYDEHVDSIINSKSNNEWLSDETTEFYSLLRSPAQRMRAKGLLYSTNQCHYGKLTVYLCNVNDPEANCSSLSEIYELSAGGRIFLFIEDTENEPDPEFKEEMKNYNKNHDHEDENKFAIANFFLTPESYKRVTVSFRIVKTVVYPDYFNRFSTQYFSRLDLDYITEQSSNVTFNARKKNETSLQMLGVSFLLSPVVTHIRMSYDDIFDQISKWGAFFNVLFTVFALIFLGFNKKKFYRKHPEWDHFKAYQKMISEQRIP